MNRILVIRLGAIGDVILTSPSLLNLKLSFPKMQITLLTRRHSAGLARLFAGVNDVVEFPHKASPVDLFRTAEDIDRSGVEMTLDLHGNLRSYYLMSHISAPTKVRYEKRRWERYRATRQGENKYINPDPPHTIDLYNDAVRKLGGKIYARRPILRLPVSGKRSSPFDNNRPVVAIAPGASFPTKQWPASRFESLALEIFYNLKADIIMILSEKDRGMVGLKEKIPPEHLKIFLNAGLTELAYTLAEANLLVCNDSGLGHLGSAVGTPVIAFFGPTHPTLGFSPRGLRDTILQVDEFCRPCSLHGRRPCFREEQFCFTRIEIETAFNKVEEMISSHSKGVPALFIDRDGTLIKEKDFISNPDDVEPEEGAIEAIKMARAIGYKIIVISNQSGVARGLFSEAVVMEINRRIIKIFGERGAGIDDILYCPHHPDGVIPEYAVECSCRKPAPGMIETAALKHNINPFRSYVIGDKLTDSNLAYVVGARGILVRSGYGKEEESILSKQNSMPPESVVDNLLEAVRYVMNAQGFSRL
jgi:histidinol-phosphate phosphatase family protein